VTAPESVLCPLTGLPFGSSRAEALEYATHLVRVGHARAISKDDRQHALEAALRHVDTLGDWESEAQEQSADFDPRKYRWLTEGQRYAYSPKLGKGDDSRRGQTCTVITVPRAGAKPANVRVRFDDGHVIIVPSGVLKAVQNVK
jgi:hypothetical protein